MNALRVETCMLYMYLKETSLISHASLESSNKESIKKKQYHYCTVCKILKPLDNREISYGYIKFF